VSETTIKPVSVRDLLKGGPGAIDGRFKLTLIRGAEAPSASNWILDEAVEKFQASLKGNVEIAEYDLSRMHIAPCVGCYGGGGRVCYLPCDRNDIESDIYDPKDEMLKIHDSIKECDALLVGTDVRWSQPAHFTSLFMERLNPFANLAQAGRPILKPKPCAVVVVNGDIGLAGGLIAGLNAAGFILPQHGYVCWRLPRLITRDGARSAYKKASDLHRDIGLVVDDLIKTGKRE
jgi:hypothetical protein